MDLASRPLHPLFVAELRGVDLSRDIDLATQQAIEHAMDEYAANPLDRDHSRAVVLSHEKKNGFH